MTFKQFILKEDSFKLHDKLNPALWEKDKLLPEVEKALKKVADVFIEFLNVKESDVADILFTGSNCNYNYHESSDCDIHIELKSSLFKTCSIDVTDYFLTKKTLWNEQHDIKIKGYEVEVYAEQEGEHFVPNMGVYSLKQNKWLVVPTIKDEVDVDTKHIAKKADAFKYEINNLLKARANELSSIKKIKEKIKKMRSDVRTGGEYSTGNLAFKELRNGGYLEKLSNYEKSLEDESLSV